MVRNEKFLLERTYWTPCNRYFTPREVQKSREVEGIFIRYKREKLKQQRKKQQKEQFWIYEPGDILLVHVDESKTPFRFSRPQRQYNYLAEYKYYRHGNVVCKLLGRGNGRMVEIPIYYTRFYAKDIDEINLHIRYNFGLSIPRREEEEEEEEDSLSTEFKQEIELLRKLPNTRAIVRR